MKYSINRALSDSAAAAISTIQGMPIKQACKDRALDILSRSSTAPMTVSPADITWYNDVTSGDASRLPAECKSGFDGVHGGVDGSTSTKGGTTPPGGGAGSGTKKPAPTPDSGFPTWALVTIVVVGGVIGGVALYKTIG
jgi:hypothetical protein